MFFSLCTVTSSILSSFFSPRGSQILEFDIMQPYELLHLGSLLISLSVPANGSPQWHVLNMRKEDIWKLKVPKVGH